MGMKLGSGVRVCGLLQQRLKLSYPEVLDPLPGLGLHQLPMDVGEVLSVLGVDALMHHSKFVQGVASGCINSGGLQLRCSP